MNTGTDVRTWPSITKDETYRIFFCATKVTVAAEVSNCTFEISNSNMRIHPQAKRLSTPPYR